MGLPGSPLQVEGDVIATKSRYRTVVLSKKLKRLLVILSFIGPALLLYFLFLLYPIIEAIRLSLFDWDGASIAMKYVGLNNYINILKDPIFMQSLGHNFYWMLVDLIIIVIPVLALAVMIGKLKKGKTFFRAGFYLPAVLSLPVVAVLWGKIFDPYIGPINVLLTNIGLDSLAMNWLGDPKTVLFSIIFTGAWAFYGLYLILFLTGLQNIDPNLYEAAEIDGAGPFRKFIYITIPSLKNIMNLVISMIIIYSLKSFALVWIMTQGGPFYKSEVVASYVYKIAFSMYKTSYGAAGSVILAIIVVILTILFNYLRERGE
jgi:raffinose/stachyose/melibiose transport system permease protein